MSTRSHWKVYITDKKYAFIFNYIQINFQGSRVFFYRQNEFCYQKNPEVSQYLKASTCTCH